MSWPIVPLREVLAADLANGKSVPDREGGFPVLRLTALRGGVLDLAQRKGGAWGAAEAEKYLVKVGDFLVARGNGSLALVGRGALVTVPPDPVAYPDTMIRVRADLERIEPRFLALAWNAPATRNQIEAMARTTAGIYKVNQTHLGSVELPVPPIDEQRRIVDLLEDHLSRIDAADAYFDAAQRSDTLLHGQLLAKELVAFPSDDVSLGDLLLVGLSNGKSVPTQDGGFPVLRLTALREGRIDLAERKEGAWTAEEAAHFLVQRGDFFVSRGNGSLRLVGRGGLVHHDPGPVAFPDTLIRARPDVGRLIPAFMALVWNSPVVRRQIEASARTTAGIYKVNQRDLEAIRLPVPSLDDQQRILESVTSSRGGLAALSREVERARTRSAGLRRSLLAAAFSNRLTNKDPDLEQDQEALG